MSKVKEALIIILVIAAVAAFFVGLIWLLWWDYDNDSAAYAEQCKQIAGYAEVTEYRSEYSDCYILKNNKIEKVEL